MTEPVTTPASFRKKPVEISAMHFAGGAKSATPVIDWILAGGGLARFHEAQDGWADADGKGCPPSTEFLAIDTREGTMVATPGDWVIRGVRGEFYPCKPDIFAATYETTDAKPDGADLISSERRRHVSEEGYTAAHDEDHEYELVDAARGYLESVHIELDGRTPPVNFVPPMWPWAAMHWKPTDLIRDLTKAGSLCAAAIDALQAEQDDEELDHA